MDAGGTTRRGLLKCVAWAGAGVLWTVIDLYVFAGPVGPLPSRGSHHGYNYLQWQQDGMRFRAVSDLNAQEMAAFADEWRRA